mmetsp:Transcript_9872/g.40460  ORF Transcript_9872/g.40460 Transcript_9872/m.40460 type:complete len:361 (+) Transcript_9872:2195-3277(+)
MIDLNSPCLAHASNISSVKLLYARAKFCFIPSGGSLVNLTLFWSKEMAMPRSNEGGGSADRNSLKFSCAPSASLSTVFSRGPLVQSIVRWMFCRSPPPPLLWKFFRLFIAMGSWPCPSETLAYLPLSAVYPSLRPRCSTAAATSTPGERKMNMGVPGAESSKDAARSKGSDVTYRSPRVFLTKVPSALDMRSGRSALNSSSCSNCSIFFQSPGIGSSSGRSSSIHSRQRLAEPTRSSPSAAYCSYSRMELTISQFASPSHSGSGLSMPSDRGARSSQSKSSASNLPCCRRTPMVSCVAMMSLCRSKRPAEMYPNTAEVTLSVSAGTRCSTGSSLPSFLSSGTHCSPSLPPGQMSIPFLRM